MEPTVLTKTEDVSTSSLAKKPSENSKQSASLKLPSSDASGSSKHEETNEDEWEDSNSIYEALLDDSEYYDYSTGLFAKMISRFAILTTFRRRVLHRSRSQGLSRKTT